MAASLARLRRARVGRVPSWGQLALALGSSAIATSCGSSPTDSRRPADSRSEGAAIGGATVGGANIDAKTESLCDGSDQIRWQYYSSFGGRAYVPPFSAEYGQRHISINGRCEFWIFDDTLRGLRRGRIDAEFASRLTRELHFGSYARFAASPYERGGCFDGGYSALYDGTAALAGECLDDSVPLGWKEAVARVDTLAVELDAISERVWHPVQILPLASPSVPQRQPIYDWNAPFDLAARAVTYTDNPLLDRDIAGFLVEDAATLARLDQLRALDIEADDAEIAGGRLRTVDRGLFVRDDTGVIFQVLIRDELPEHLRSVPQ